MIYLKTYENDKEQPEVGDYVICKHDKNKIGKILGIYGREKTHVISYEDTDMFYQLRRHDIIDFSKDKKELEIIATSNKYNI